MGEAQPHQAEHTGHVGPSDKLRQSQDMHIVYLCFALQAIGVCGACPQDLRTHGIATLFQLYENIYDIKF
jgi:hypothetical protein